MDIYAENILDHYRHPRGKVRLAVPSAEQKEVNLSCGDEVAVQLAINDDRITEIGWEGTGCAISQAAMSILGEELVGKSLDEINVMKAKDMHELLGVPVGPRRFKCALLGLHAVKNAVLVYQKKPVQGWSETAGE
jgi:nitrogen fixation NifU-like protein